MNALREHIEEIEATLDLAESRAREAVHLAAMQADVLTWDILMDLLGSGGPLAQAKKRLEWARMAAERDSKII